MTTPVECAARCGTPMDPVLIAEGWTQHPGCEFGLVVTAQDLLDGLRDQERVKRQRGEPLRGTTWFKPKRRRPTVGGVYAEPNLDPGPVPSPEARAKRQPKAKTAGPSIPRRGTAQRTIYDLIEKAGARGLAPFEILRQVPEDIAAHSSITAHLAVLHGKLSAIVRAPKKRETPRGAHEDVWVAHTQVPEAHRS